LNILYLSYDGLTDPLGQSQILPYLTGLASLGHQITVISAEKKENYLLRKAVIDKIISPFGNALRWEPIFYTKKPPVLATLYDISKLEKKAEALHKTKHFDLLHCRSYIAALVGERLKKKYGIKFIFDMRGFWADERVEGNIWDVKHPVFKKIYEYFKRKEKDFLKNAAYTISLTVTAKEEILSWQGFENIPIQVIPCCVDTELFDTEKLKMVHLEKYWQELNIMPEEWVISYLGSLGTWYMTDEMLYFFKKLEQKYPEVKFLFITTDNPEIVLEKARQLGIAERKFIFRKAERREVPALLKISRFSVFFVKPTYAKKASSPTKMGEILSMGIPVVCNANIGDTAHLFENHTCGVLLQDFSEESMQKAVNEIDTMLKIPKEALRKTALDYFDLQKGIAAYHEVYRQVKAK
jgi:glycosyltransferase involved in cell wall biosynthesis